MLVTAWFDPKCLWSHVGRDRTALLADLGFTVIEQQRPDDRGDRHDDAGPTP